MTAACPITYQSVMVIPVVQVQIEIAQTSGGAGASAGVVDWLCQRQRNDVGLPLTHLI